MTAKSFRVALQSLFVGAVLIYALPVEADTIFWLQNTPNAATPAPLILGGPTNSAGTLYLFGTSDTARVSAVGFDLTSSNTAALSFTTPFSFGPQNSTAWAFNGPTVSVTAGSVQHIDGIAIPGFSGQGFGPGSSIGNTMLLASVGYQVGTGSSTTSTISLKVDSNGVVDFNGAYLPFHVGSSQSATLDGGNVGASASIGSLALCSCGVSVSSQTFKNVFPGSPGFVDYQVQTVGDLPVPGPVTFDGIDGPYYIGPTFIPRDDIKPATFDLNTGKFHWDTTGAVPGSYSWFVAASAQGYTGQGMIQVQVVPEPSALALLVGMGLITALCRRTSDFEASRDDEHRFASRSKSMHRDELG